MQKKCNMISAINMINYKNQKQQISYHFCYQGDLLNTELVILRQIRIYIVSVDSVV